MEEVFTPIERAALSKRMVYSDSPAMISDCEVRPPQRFGKLADVIRAQLSPPDPSKSGGVGQTPRRDISSREPRTRWR